MDEKLRFKALPFDSVYPTRLATSVDPSTNELKLLYRPKHPLEDTKLFQMVEDPASYLLHDSTKIANLANGGELKEGKELYNTSKKMMDEFDPLEIDVKSDPIVPTCATLNSPRDQAAAAASASPRGLSSSSSSNSIGTPPTSPDLTSTPSSSNLNAAFVLGKKPPPN